MRGVGLRGELSGGEHLFCVCWFACVQEVVNGVLQLVQVHEGHLDAASEASLRQRLTASVMELEAVHRDLVLQSEAYVRWGLLEFVVSREVCKPQATHTQRRKMSALAAAKD